MREQTKFMTILVLILMIAGCGRGYRPPIVDVREPPGINLSNGNYNAAQWRQ